MQRVAANLLMLVAFGSSSGAEQRAPDAPELVSSSSPSSCTAHSGRTFTTFSGRRPGRGALPRLPSLPPRGGCRKAIDDNRCLVYFGPIEVGLLDRTKQRNLGLTRS